MAKWIDVKDSVPNHEEEVLVYVDGHRSPSWCNSYCLVAYYSQIGRHFRTFDGRDEVPGIVTHWMPLPKSPR